MSFVYDGVPPSLELVWYKLAVQQDMVHCPISDSCSWLGRLQGPLWAKERTVYLRLTHY